MRELIRKLGYLSYQNEEKIFLIFFVKSTWRVATRIEPAPKNSKPLIVAAGTIRAGTVVDIYNTLAEDEEILI